MTPRRRWRYGESAGVSGPSEESRATASSEVLMPKGAFLFTQSVFTLHLLMTWVLALRWSSICRNEVVA
jgi:hypothetical protein